MLGRKNFHHHLALAVLTHELSVRININSGLEIVSGPKMYEPKFNNDFMQTRERHRDSIRFTKDDVLPLDELRRKQRAGEFLTHGEKKRLIQDAEATRKSRQAQMKKKRK